MERIESLKREITKRRIGAFLITNLKNIRYLAGFSGSSGALLITSREAFFITDFRYREQSEREVKGCQIVITRHSPFRTIREILKKNRIKRVGFEYNESFAIYDILRRDFRPFALKNVVEDFRKIKDAEELRNIRKAVKRAEDAFLNVKPYIKVNTTERAVALRLEEELKKSGCKRLPFDIIVASGPNAAMPHATVTERKLQPGDLVVIDWGGESDGYFSDMTRTLLLNGANIGKKKEIYHAVVRANRAAINAVKEGVKAKDVDRVARQIIKESGYGEYFGHATGHGLGLDIHEAPRISFMSRDVLKKGMVFTIEPGIYVPGLGGVRIEDMVTIKDSGTQRLTSLSRRLEII
ncbi:MAG: aminopeptidase P family protein [Nitrospirae bacterium]|nr:aminopeptidase P family protein [Nitrospirota bacterium]